MFEFADLSVPIVAAPMTGGPSTPALIARVGHAGGMGFLGGGFKTPAALAAEIDEVRSRTDAPFGVNLFVPNSNPVDVEAVRAYRDRVGETAAKYGIDLPEVREFDDDHFDGKVEVLVEHAVPVVSLTFGLPPAAVLTRLREAGCAVVATVTDAAESRLAVDAGVDALCLQGPDGGGHRGTFGVADEPGTASLDDLLADVRSWCPIPIMVAGGIGDGARIAELLNAGAAAVQLGTAFLRSPESGAKQAHKDALADPRYTDTVVTRAFSGRPARGLVNEFVTAYGAAAPAIYPQVHHVTSPIRAAAAARNAPEDMALWAGAAYRRATTEPAAEIVTRLWKEARSHGATH